MIWIQVTLSAVFICIISPKTDALKLLGLDYYDASLSADAVLHRAVRSAEDFKIPDKIPDKVKTDFTNLVKSISLEAMSSQRSPDGQKQPKDVKISPEHEKRFCLIHGLVLPAAVWIATRSNAPLQPRNLGETPAGIAEIHYYREDVICTGIHLKPWIVMAVGDCLYGREMKKLFVRVNAKTEGKIRTANVQVNSVVFHPQFKQGDRRNNMALMLIYSQMDWNVGSFIMPQKDYPVDELINKKLPLFVHEFKEGKAVLVGLTVTKDTTVCGALGTAAGWYCVYRNGKQHTYYSRDVGTPFVYQKGSDRVLLGHYTGIKMSESAPGHMFQAVHSTVYWVEEFIHEHPVPPEF